MRRPHPRFGERRNAWVTKAGGRLKTLTAGPKNTETEAAAVGRLLPPTIINESRGVITDAVQQGRTWKLDPIEIIEKETGLSERKLYYCARFADRFDDELLQLAIGASLGWSHVTA